MANLKPPVKKKETQPSAERCDKTQDIEEVINNKTGLDQTPPDVMKSVQLLVPLTKAQEFKSYAAAYGLPMNKLFLEMFEEHKAKRKQNQLL